MYHGTLHKWLGAFAGRLHVVLYDDLRGDPVGTLTGVARFLGLPEHNFTAQRAALQHEFQRGSQYAPYTAPLVARLAEEFRPHNELLAVLLDRPIPWDDKLRDAQFTLPLNL